MDKITELDMDLRDAVNISEELFTIAARLDMKGPRVCRLVSDRLNHLSVDLGLDDMTVRTLLGISALINAQERSYSGD